MVPEEGEKLSNAPPNTFMPNPDNLVCIKKNKEVEAKKSIPIKLKTSNDEFYELWFKQDDTFQKPVITINGRIMTNACGYPFTLQSHILANLWLSVQAEFLRETNYMA